LNCGFNKIKKIFKINPANPKILIKSQFKQKPT
jgi:hypothetical protein